MTVAIIGAGLAGLACATRLAEAGRSVALFDKGRAPGGRMSTRVLETPLGEARVDHGAQYFTARDPVFRARVDGWAQDDVVAPWPAAGEDAWVGVPGMDAPAAALAAGLDVRRSSRVEALRRDPGGWRLLGADLDAGPFEAVAIAIPAEQVGALAGPWDPALAAEAAATPAQPCWTVMAVFAERLPIPADVLKKRGIVDWAARDSAKPGRGGPERWVVHAVPDWSRHRIEDAPEAVIPPLLAALADAAGHPLPEPVAVAAHRWRYARSGRLNRDSLWNGDLGLGLCGDWLLGPRVECAWLSGDALAGRIGGA